MQTRETAPKNPLLPTEADDVWNAHCSDVATGIVGFIRTMGLPAALTSAESSDLGRVPTKSQVRRLLLGDFDNLHVPILEAVERDFRRSVQAGRVDRDRAGGFLNTVTQRKTWKFATRRARELLATVQPHANEWDSISCIRYQGSDPEELLANREAFDRLGQAMSKLCVADRQLIEAKLAGNGYAELARRRATSVGALKTRASRLWREVSGLVRGERPSQ